MKEMTLAELKDALRNGTRVILQVRHAERPRMDPDDPSFGDALALTKEGVRTAKALGAALAEFRDEVQFYASPLMRTRMTAAGIAEGMGLADAEIPTDDLLGNGSFFYDDPAQVLDVFKPENFFNACFEYFATGHQRGFKDLASAADACERWLLEHQRSRLFVVATHDLYIAAFLFARKAVREFTRDNWPRFLDGGAILIAPDGTRSYALVRTGLSHGICGVRKIAAVVFDFGGVMTTSTMPERVRKCTEEFGIEWTHLETGFAKYRRLMDGGFITMDQMYDLIWADAGLTISAEQQERILKEDYASFLDGYRNLKTLAWMRELKAAGYRIGILTNMPPAMAPMFEKTFADFIAEAEVVVISGHERMYKPQRRIYELCRKRFGLTCSELCFVDDVEQNCEGARRAGWRAVRFADNEQVRRDFAALVA